MTRLVLICGEDLLLLDQEGPPDRVNVSAGAAGGLARLNAARAVAVLVEEGGAGDAGLGARRREQLLDGLARHGARLDEILDSAPGATALADAFRTAIRRFNVTPATTPVLAETLPALEAAASLGCRRLLVRTRKGRSAQAQGVPDSVLPVSVHSGLAVAVEALLQEGR
jgi:hypothetical protein